MVVNTKYNEPQNTTTSYRIITTRRKVEEQEIILNEKGMSNIGSNKPLL